MSVRSHNLVWSMGSTTPPDPVNAILTDGISRKVLPARYLASGETGIKPRFAIIATKLNNVPKATIRAPNMWMLRSRANSNSV